MEILFVLVLVILVLTSGLQRLAIKIGARPAGKSDRLAAAHIRSRNPYLDFSFEGDLYPILNHPDTPRRIEECANGLHNARQRLAEQFGRRVFQGGNVESGHNHQFIQAWKAVCEVSRAKYGDVIFTKGLNLAGYREPGSFEAKYDW